MWNRFTTRARHATHRAQEEAAKLGQSFVGGEHLLLGLMGDPENTASQALSRLGLIANHIRTDVERQAERNAARLGEAMELTPRAKRIVDLAYLEAKELGQHCIGTEHLLLGLIREGEGLAARVLIPLGAELAAARTAVQSIATPEVVQGESMKAQPQEPTAPEITNEQALAALTEEQRRQMELGRMIENLGKQKAELGRFLTRNQNASFGLSLLKN